MNGFLWRLDSRWIAWFMTGWWLSLCLSTCQVCCRCPLKMHLSEIHPQYKQTDNDHQSASLRLSFYCLFLLILPCLDFPSFSFHFFISSILPSHFILFCWLITFPSRRRPVGWLGLGEHKLDMRACWRLFGLLVFWPIWLIHWHCWHCCACHFVWLCLCSVALEWHFGWFYLSWVYIFAVG